MFTSSAYPTAFCAYMCQDSQKNKFEFIPQKKKTTYLQDLEMLNRVESKCGKLSTPDLQTLSLHYFNVNPLSGSCHVSLLCNPFVVGKIPLTFCAQSSLSAHFILFLNLHFINACKLEAVSSKAIHWVC